MLIKKLSQTVKRHSMLHSGDSVLVCVSGGPDSMCLLHALLAVREKFELCIHICHFDHMIRGRESGLDREFVESFARVHKLPFFSSRKNVRLHARRNKLSIEEAGRNLRHAFFIDAAKKNNIPVIATGHHMDDQAETVLINLLRGAGVAGLSGIPPVREDISSGIRIIRPLITIRRFEIIRYLQKNQIPFREDRSNAETVYLRNSIRLELLPFLESKYGPGIAEKLARTAEIMEEHKDYLNLARATLAESLKSAGHSPPEIPLKALNDSHPASNRILFQSAFNAAEGGDAVLSYNHIDQLNRLARSKKPNLKLDLPSGVTCVREYNRIIFKKGIPEKPEAQPTEQMRIPGKNELPGFGCTLEFSVSGAKNSGDSGGTDASIDFDKVKFPLYARSRKDGDRFSPLGMRGTRKLKDFFIDKKIPLADRDRKPVVIDSDGRIICILDPVKRSGTIENRVRITPRTERVLQVRIV